MDLIYTDARGVDIGVLEAYELDMAFGKDENDFECTVDSSDHCCEPGSKIYAEGEEYGGVVDSIAVDTEAEKITYKGRTWHGVLEGKVICPEEGQDYLVLSGEANQVLGQIISLIDAEDIFTASTADSGIDIHAYQVPRYVYAYTGIRNMLKAAGGKLHMQWTGSHVELSVLPAMDYSQDEEFDASQTTFSLEQQYNPVNHLICLGQGDLAERAVIHIFCDENGGVQPYANAETPIQDSDYILDTSQQVMTGIDEIMETLDYPSAEIVINYDPLTAKPEDWETNCSGYFRRDTEGDAVSYKAVDWEVIEYALQKMQPYDWTVNFANYFTRSDDNYSAVSGTTVYTLQSVKPSDWNSKYASYFRRSGSSYTEVEAVVSEAYVRQTRQPADWWSNYKEYYYFYSDGVTSEYKQTDGISYNIYNLQTRQPTDWAEQYSSYYRKSTAAELKKESWKIYRQVEAATKKTTNAKGQTVTKQVAPTWKARKYYTAKQMEKAPTWNAVTRYTFTRTESAPAWAANTYYTKVENNAPAWAANTYYTKVDEKVAPAWGSETFYRAVEDHYATMIKSALERMEEAHESSPMEISLEESDTVYDIGDIVGVIEPTTGISATQEIVKKVIKITNDDIKITYEVK